MIGDCYTYQCTFSLIIQTFVADAELHFIFVFVTILFSATTILSAVFQPIK